MSLTCFSICFSDRRNGLFFVNYLFEVYKINSTMFDRGRLIFYRVIEIALYADTLSIDFDRSPTKSAMRATRERKFLLKSKTFGKLENRMFYSEICVLAVCG